MKTKKEKEKTTNVKTEEVKGEEAIKNLFEEMEKDGIVLQTKTFDVVEKIKKLETELETLKDLMSRSLKTKKSSKVLKG